MKLTAIKTALRCNNVNLV